MKFQHMKVLDDAELDSLRQKSEVSAVYYYKRDIPRLKGFLKELDKSAEYLKLYGVEVGFFDCGNLHEAKEPKCNEHNAEFQIFTYKSNYVLLELGLETMFDINSIMSNMLQLVLIHDVPILQSVEERLEYENKYKGEKDILFTYQKAIGTFDHRIFMEVAFAYQDKFKFAVCTNKKAVEDLNEPAFNVEKSEKAIWVLRCKKWKYKEIKCPHWRYNQRHDLANLAAFVKILTYPSVFMMPSDGIDIPYYQDKGMPVVYFMYDKLSKDQALDAARDTSDAFYSLVGVIALDTDALEKTSLTEMGYNGPYPAVAFHTKTMDKPVIMQIKDWNLQPVHQFIVKNLNSYQRPGLDPEAQSDPMAMVEGSKMPHHHMMDDHDNDDDDDDEYPVEQFTDEEIKEVETQDDEVAEAVFQSRRKPPQVDLIDALTDQTFPATIKNKDLVFVLFYLPFDDKSIAFLYAYADASREIESDPARPLTRVNCHDWTDVCSKENIMAYPTVRMYRSGKMLKDYNGLLDTKAVVTTVKLLNQTNPLNLKDPAGVMDLMNGVLPNGDPVVTETVVMALLDRSHDKEMMVFETVASHLEDEITFAYNKDGVANKIPDFKFKVPSIVVLRRSDILKPHVVYTGDMDVEKLKEFIKKASIPSMPELTVEWFPMLYRQGKPFVILFLDSYQESARVKKVLEDVVLSAKFPNIQFVWMKAEPMTTGRTVLNEYDKDNRVPAISYVSLKNGTVFNNKDDYPTEETVSKWLTDIISEKITPSKILEKGDWKPTKRGYDFLSMIDKENEKKKKKLIGREHVEKVTVNEQGIGFDKDGKEMDISGHTHPMDMKLPDNKEEDEIREELLKSRLYRSGPGRKHKDHMTDEVHHRAGHGKMDTSRDHMTDAVHHTAGLGKMDTSSNKDKPHMKKEPMHEEL